MTLRDVSLCMMVKNEEANLGRALATLWNRCGEIIVIDTGSTDATRTIATAFGARVHDFPFTGDFSAARNFALQHATRRWILVLDADEFLYPGDVDRLEAVLSDAPPRTVFQLWRCHYLACGSVGFDWITRLFPRTGEIYYTRPIHEKLTDAIARSGYQLSQLDITVQHLGFTAPARAQRRKQETYIEHQTARVAADPRDADAYPGLIMHYLMLREFGAAAAAFQQVRTLPVIPIRSFLYAAWLYREAGLHEEERRVCEDGLRRQPRWEPLTNMLGLHELRAGRTERALARFDEALASAPRLAILHINRGIALTRLGEWARARAAFQHAAELSPRLLGFAPDPDDAAIDVARPYRAVPDEFRGLAWHLCEAEHYLGAGPSAAAQLSPALARQLAILR